MNKLKLIATILCVVFAIVIFVVGIILRDVWQVFVGVWMQLYIMEVYEDSTTKSIAEKLNDKLIDALNNKK
jgi:hypothetical protein